MAEQITILGSDGLPVRSSGEWVKRKHHYLRRYCDMFATSMRNKWSTVFLDVMAGPGRCKIEETGEELPGSPLVALEHKFHSFIFCEQDRISHDALRARLQTGGRLGDWQLYNSNWAACEPLFKPFAPKELVLAFIDPTGVSQVPWTALNRLIESHPKIDLLMTIQHGMGIKLNQHQYVGSQDWTALDSFLGSNDWRNHIKAGPHFCDDVLAIYSKQLRDKGFTTAQWITVRSDSNAPLYYLCLFSRSSLAMEFWSKVVVKDEKGQVSWDF